MRNYVAYGKTFFGLWLCYAYLDVPENLSFDVLERNGVRAKFVRALTRPDEEYVLVEVKVRKADREKFLDAMEDLKTKMLLCGHPDYLSHGGELMEKTLDALKKDVEMTGRIPLPMGGSVRARALPEM